jgi:hypothetical protein
MARRGPKEPQDPLQEPIPRVTLDTTFANLYDDKRGVLVLSTQLLNRYVDPKGKGSLKYCYHDIVNDTDSSDNSEQDILGFHMEAQRNAYIAGSMKVLFFTSLSRGNPNDGKIDMAITMDGINVNQQPKLAFAASPKTTRFSEDWKLVPILPVDCFKKHNLLISLSTHYEIISKRGLAVSDLPNPTSVLLDFETGGKVTESEKKMHDEKVFRAIQGCSLPFAVKLQQTISGYGTFAVADEAARFRAIVQLTLIFQKLSRKVTVENIRLHPATVVVTELIHSERPMEISFFVRPNGKVFFISGAWHSPGAWHNPGAWRNAGRANLFDGHVVKYSEQNTIKGKVSGLLDKVAKFVYRKGYYGPVGINILRERHTDRLVIVDLNIRPCASHIMGLLRGHFEPRGLDWAGLKEMVKVPFTRLEFADRLKNEMINGELVVVAWYEDRRGGGSWGSFAIGTQSEESLVSALKYIQELKATKEDDSSGLTGEAKEDNSSELVGEAKEGNSSESMGEAKEGESMGEAEEGESMGEAEEGESMGEAEEGESMGEAEEDNSSDSSGLYG